MWNRFTEAAAESETLLEAIMVVIVHWPGNPTSDQYFHGELSEDNHISFRGAVFSEMLQKNAGRLSGCI